MTRYLQKWAMSDCWSTKCVVAFASVQAEHIPPRSMELSDNRPGQKWLYTLPRWRGRSLQHCFSMLKTVWGAVQPIPLISPSANPQISSWRRFLSSPNLAKPQKPTENSNNVYFGIIHPQVRKTPDEAVRWNWPQGFGAFLPSKRSFFMCQITCAPCALVEDA